MRADPGSRAQRRTLFLASAVLVPLLTRAAVDPAPTGAPRTEFVPPAPGSYVLQRIQRVGDYPLLDVKGGTVQLQSLLRGRVTLLTFFYASCGDPLGCPLAFALIRGVREQAKADPQLADAQFVSISLDPRRDTPAQLAQYEAAFADQRGPQWRFLTTRGMSELRPLLADFGQDISVAVQAAVSQAPPIHHMLKMFLIDRTGEVREIYSLAFMQPAMVLGDLRTLALERLARAD